MKYTLEGVRVSTDGDDYFIAPTAAVIGKVRLKKNASVWWNAVIRGDNELITVGENSNIQDGCILHTDIGFPCTVGANATIGHMAVLHGCVIGDGSMVGIGAVVLNGVTVGKNCIIGSNALIPDGKQIPDNSIVMGSPGKIVRETTEADIAYIQETVEFYVDNQDRFKNALTIDD
jgi:carbonic anhydrase/acetyltransferase-like protein (isoleucine patch superfamily)